MSPRRDKPCQPAAHPDDIGTLDAAGNLTVDGTVSGAITHERDVTIGPRGSVYGKVSARAIVVHGEVQGDLHATSALRVTGTGRVKGDLQAPRINVETGARLRGRIIMRHRPEHQMNLGEFAVDELLSGR